MQKFNKLLCLILSMVYIFQLKIYADDANIDGGGGSMGVGSNSNGWVITSTSGVSIYDAEGFRVYLVNSSTGVPVSSSVDITNASVAKEDVINGRGKTKYEYKHLDSSLSFDTSYQYIKVNTSPNKLPQIIPWNESSGSVRISDIKDWFLNPYYADWVLGKLSTTIEEVRAGGYFLALEPIAYFRYGGMDYAMTATEAALFNTASGGSLYNYLYPLTHKNLPLSIFLEKDEFTTSSYIMRAWIGSKTAIASDNDILNQLGIGYIHYVESEDEPEELTGTGNFSYPVNTWVVTPFRLCNVEYSGGSWTNGYNITSKNPATVQINVAGTNYTISNVYVPSGSEQIVWVKWKTPPTPQTLTITTSSNKGLFYNMNNSGSYNMYVTSLTVTVDIIERKMENEPPDPTLNDTPSKFNYSPTSSVGEKDYIITHSNSTSSWYVWDCYFGYENTYTNYYSETDSYPDYPTGNSYNASTGIYTERSVEDSYSTTYTVPIGTEGATYSYTVYSVVVRFDEYKYRYGKINYSAEVKNAIVSIKPDIHCPTAYTSGGTTYMKSGYGLSIEAETYLLVSVHNERTGTTTTDTYYSASSTSYAACAQYMFSSFPEFEYSRYNRQLEYESGKYVFKKNRYSTYNSRVHYTPWWFPDNQKYQVVIRSEYAYAPTGRIYLNSESNSIMIDGNLYDDWVISPFKT